MHLSWSTGVLDRWPDYQPLLKKGALGRPDSNDGRKKNLIKVLYEQTREVNKRIKIFFELCFILVGFGNIVADFHV